MQLFFSELIQNNAILLINEEALHCYKVLRKKSGDTIDVTDGKGNLFHTTISDINVKKNEVLLFIQNQSHLEKPANEFHIALSVLKSPDRFEWFVEKACEMGITTITPMICERTEKKKCNTDRLRKISISACKQSLNYHFPTIEEPQSFTEILKKKPVDMLSIIPVCFGNTLPINKTLIPGKHTLALIGPEGDFTETELHQAIENGLIPVNMGKQRLRSETAALYSVFCFHSINFNL